MVTTMGHFYPHCLRDVNDTAKTYIRCHSPRRPSCSYETLWKHLNGLSPEGMPQSIALELERAKAIYDRPAAPKMTKEQKEDAVLHCLSLFGDPPPDFNDERLPEFVKDGYRYYVRRVFLPPGGGVPVSERDVEYRIQATNLEFTKLKKEHQGWSCWVYVNRPGYLCDGNYPSLRNTDYGVQWGRGFNW